MKKIIVMLCIATFAGALAAQTSPQQPAGKDAPRVSQDKGKDKDDGKHVGEGKEHHRHHRHHHEHKEGGKK